MIENGVLGLIGEGKWDIVIENGLLDLIGERKSYIVYGRKRSTDR